MRQFLRAKLHSVTVTNALLDYEGSFGIDSTYLERVGILPYESIEVYNVTTGARIRTYAIPTPAGSRRFESNGAAAHLIRKGDKVIIACYALLTDEELTKFKGPRVLILDSANEAKIFYDSKSARFDEASLQLPA